METNSIYPHSNVYKLYLKFPDLSPMEWWLMKVFKFGFLHSLQFTLHHGWQPDEELLSLPSFLRDSLEFKPVVLCKQISCSQVPSQKDFNYKTKQGSPVGPFWHTLGLGIEDWQLGENTDKCCSNSIQRPATEWGYQRMTPYVQHFSKAQLGMSYTVMWWNINREKDTWDIQMYFR